MPGWEFKVTRGCGSDVKYLEQQLEIAWHSLPAGLAMSSRDCHCFGGYDVFAEWFWCINMVD
jgi:hypothetical protein